MDEYGFGLSKLFRIWINWISDFGCWLVSGIGFGCWIGFGFFLQDIGVDRDVKMLKCSALCIVFRAAVLFLRRLVISPGFLVFLPASPQRGEPMDFSALRFDDRSDTNVLAGYLTRKRASAQFLS
jgi:hypothetical protein